MLMSGILGIGLGFCSVAIAWGDTRGISFAGKSGPGQGKRVVLVSGDEEYRSEEALPQLAKILARQHGFECTVLFAIDPQTGLVNPNVNNNIPGLEHLESADLLVLFTRFRNLPADQMRHISKYLEQGKPIIGLRTATHAFAPAKTAGYQQYHWQAKDWDGGFGRKVLGETWVSHHGKHGQQSTRGILAPGQERHPILRGIKTGDIWGPTDVYGVHQPLPGDALPLVLGSVLTGMQPTDPPVAGKQNEPMMPIAWTKTYTVSPGKTGRVFTTTMGAATDLESAGLRRLLVNACYWAVGLEAKISPESSVHVEGDYRPSPFKFNGYVPGRKPEYYREH